jgi:ectoine hydroxylase-related dioxygenase (phytanoyl-CoA dioxygenase family)
MAYEDFRSDGCCLLQGAFTDWVDVLRAGVERTMADPGPYAAENTKDGEPGRFFDDYCNWDRIPEFTRFVRESDVGRLAAQVMDSNTAQMFHEHVLVKEPGTVKPTPWHQDMPYYFVEGTQTVSLWIPLDPVDADTTLLFLAGSHRWPRFMKPVAWLDDADFYADDASETVPVPQPGAIPDDMPVRGWPMQPGDAVAFDFRTAHGAMGNPGAARRRAFSIRLVGDDARYVTRPGRTSPPFPGHGMQDGQKLREDWFPVIYDAGAPSA